MGQELSRIGHSPTHTTRSDSRNGHPLGSNVRDKALFDHIFKKDIRRVYIFKKSERLSHVLLRVLPAFKDQPHLKDRLERSAVALLEQSMTPGGAFRDGLASELLVVTSVLSAARTSGVLSPMNADIISRETQLLLDETTAYEESNLYLEEIPSLAVLGKAVSRERSVAAPRTTSPRPHEAKGQEKDREQAIVSVIKDKGKVGIKEIAHFFKQVSEKTIQRELAQLVSRGIIKKEGERRWSVYSVV